MSTLTDLANGLAIEAIHELGEQQLTVSACLSIDRPETITNFGKFAALLESAYNKGVASQLAMERTAHEANERYIAERDAYRKERDEQCQRAEKAEATIERCFSSTAVPIGWANGDELSNILDDRTATISGKRTGWYGTAVYTATPILKPGLYGEFVMLPRTLTREMRLVAATTRHNANISCDDIFVRLIAAALKANADPVTI